MQIYLPIAQISVDFFTLAGLGFAVGILSGLFGIGGGFVMTPILFFMGVPANIAVASQSSQLVGTSTAGALVHYRRRNIDFRMGLILFAGGFVGSALGVRAFVLLTQLGFIESFVSIAYVLLLGSIGTLIIIEVIQSLRSQKRTGRGVKHYPWHHWPLRMRFPASRLYASAIPFLGLGMLVGFLAAILGVGGGFLLVPLLIYVMGVPTKTVIGTSIFQILLVTAVTTMLHATTTGAVDIVLATILILGSVPGAQVGALMAVRIPALYLRLGLGLVILLITLRLILDLTIMPAELYSLET